MSLGSNQPLKQMSTRNISWGTVHMADKLTTFMCKCLEVWEPQPPGTLSTLQYASTEIAVPLPLSQTVHMLL
jgi:hypothetical protein